jgi:murein DD-endopeptidase MepM/ murein hydrolase activator NlpD
VRLWVDLAEPAKLEGAYRNETLRFSPTHTGAWALVAIGPLSPVETFPLVITATTATATASVSLPIAVQDANFRTQNLRLNPQTSQLLDPELVENEAARLEALFKSGHDAPMWDGIFITPGRGRITADFGERRRYNDGPIKYHEGIDYGMTTGSPVRAAARGVVALAEPLTVRGNAVFIDHGMGVYTGYFHMSELLVEPGETVQPLQIIGRVGSTGLSTGPHLHWEFRLHGINVSPWQWMQENMP